MTEAESVELKACAHCGRSDGIVDEEYDEQLMEDRWRVVSDYCGCGTGWCKSKAEAIAAWNTRRPDEGVAGVGEPDHVIRKGGYFYRPNAHGYCADVRDAGLWSFNEASHLISHLPIGEVSVHHISEFIGAGRPTLKGGGR